MNCISELIMGMFCQFSGFISDITERISIKLGITGEFKFYLCRSNITPTLHEAQVLLYKFSPI